MLLKLPAHHISGMLVGFEKSQFLQMFGCQPQMAYVLHCRKLTGNSNYSSSYSSLCFRRSEVISSVGGKNDIVNKLVAGRGEGMRGRGG